MSKWRRALDRVRRAALEAGQDWPAVERETQARRPDLLAEATGVAAGRWRELLPGMAQAGRDGPKSRA